MSLSGNHKFRLQRYAIRNLSLVLIICYAFGYLIQMVNPSFSYYISLDPYAIVHGQIWRLVTWLLIPPPTSNIIFTAIMLYFYYSIGTTLERTWGTVRYNVYIFSGFLFTIAGAFVMMGWTYLFHQEALGTYGAAQLFRIISMSFSTYYVNLSIFLAFAVTYPEMQVLLMFLIPIRVKWLGVLDAVLLVYEAFTSPYYVRIAILASLLNFLILWFRSRNWKRISPSEVRRRNDFKRAVQSAQQTGSAPGRMQPKSQAAHRCSICGRTDITNPELEFRFCSKCAGAREYCQEHLFTHVHVQ